MYTKLKEFTLEEVDDIESKQHESVMSDMLKSSLELVPQAFKL